MLFSVSLSRKKKKSKRCAQGGGDGEDDADGLAGPVTRRRRTPRRDTKTGPSELVVPVCLDQFFVHVHRVIAQIWVQERLVEEMLPGPLFSFCSFDVFAFQFLSASSVDSI